MTRIFFSNSWKLIFDLLLFFLMRFICTHIIAYRQPDRQVWPDTSFFSISNVPKDQIQYQVSAYTGLLMLALLYWKAEGAKPLMYLALLCLLASIVLELSFRVSYSTDIFAAVLIAHLFSSLNKAWCVRLDKYIMNAIREFWLKRTDGELDKAALSDSKE
jgi:hypothetical protein